MKLKTSEYKAVVLASDRAGKEFYSMAVDLRGFYLKVSPTDLHHCCIFHPAPMQPPMMTGNAMQLGQFFAARAEFVPEPICRHLSLLHDRVSASDHALH